MPTSDEIAPLWSSRSSIPAACRKRAAVVTRVEKPSPVHPVHAGGRQCSPSSARCQNFTVGESARLGIGGMESTPQGGCGPDWVYPYTWQHSIARPQIVKVRTFR